MFTFVTAAFVSGLVVVGGGLAAAALDGMLVSESVPGLHVSDADARQQEIDNFPAVTASTEKDRLSFVNALGSRCLNDLLSLSQRGLNMQSEAIVKEVQSYGTCEAEPREVRPMIDRFLGLKAQLDYASSFDVVAESRRIEEVRGLKAKDKEYEFWKMGLLAGLLASPVVVFSVYEANRRY